MEMGARQALLRAATEAAPPGRAGRELAPDWPKRRQSTSDGDYPFATNDPSVSEADPDRLARRVCENLDEALRHSEHRGVAGRGATTRNHVAS